MELDLAKKKLIMPIVDNSHWDNFLACTKVADKDLYVVHSDFFIKMADFVGIFFKFQEYVDERKHYQAKMKKTNCMVEDIFVFQESCLEALTKIPEMSSHDKECYIQAFDMSVERGK